MKKSLVLLSFAFLTACSRHVPPSGPVRHYPVTGRILALDAAHQTATIDAAAIPNYMEAMRMDYPIASKDEFRTLKVGERILGTLDVTADESYSLSHIKPAAQ